MSQCKPPTRAYRSPRRAAATGATRERIVEAALGVLREGAVDRLTLEAVGQAAGVTRPTVYNQFGSRRALLEAAFDRFAVTSAIADIPAVMSIPDPHEALTSFIAVFCGLWAGEPIAFAALEAAGKGDPEFERGLAARTERRRYGFRVLVDRLAGQSGAGAPDKAALVDLLFVLTSRASHAGLSRDGRGAGAVEAIIQQAAADAVRGTFG